MSACLSGRARGGGGCGGNMVWMGRGAPWGMFGIPSQIPAPSLPPALFLGSIGWWRKGVPKVSHCAKSPIRGALRAIFNGQFPPTPPLPQNIRSHLSKAKQSFGNAALELLRVQLVSGPGDAGDAESSGRRELGSHHTVPWLWQSLGVSRMAVHQKTFGISSSLAVALHGQVGRLLVKLWHSKAHTEL